MRDGGDGRKAPKAQSPQRTPPVGRPWRTEASNSRLRRPGVDRNDRTVAGNAGDADRAGRAGGPEGGSAEGGAREQGRVGRRQGRAGAMNTLLLSLRGFNSRQAETTVRPWPCAHDNQLLAVFNPSEATKLSQGWASSALVLLAGRGEGFQPSEASTRGAQQLTRYRGDSLSRRGRPRAFQAGHDHAGGSKSDRPAASTAAFYFYCSILGSSARDRARRGGTARTVTHRALPPAPRPVGLAKAKPSSRVAERARAGKRRADSVLPGFIVDDGPEREKEGGKGRGRGPGESRRRAASATGARTRDPTGTRPPVLRNTLYPTGILRRPLIRKRR